MPRLFRNKNDFIDAEAIAEAVERKNMRFVPIKTDDQLDLHLARFFRMVETIIFTTVICAARLAFLSVSLVDFQSRGVRHSGSVPTAHDG